MSKHSTSLKETVYIKLKDMIINCELAPGARLTEDEFCEMMSASRTPIRDALSRLEQEQLITINSKKGIEIKRVSISNVHELFEARLQIEPFVVAKYGNRISVEKYAEFIALSKEQIRERKSDYQIDYQIDDEFHQMFVEASGNRYLMMFYNTIKDQVMRYRVLSNQEDRLELSREEHLEIASNCLRGNWDDAAEAMRKHIENSRLAIINYALTHNLDAKNIFAEPNE